MNPENDKNLSIVQNIAKELNKDREDIGESVGELRESVYELHREPRTAVEFTERELEDAIFALDRIDWKGDAYQKLTQALAIESAPGGKFFSPPDVAA